MKDIVDDIADKLVEDHVSLMNECRELRQQRDDLLAALELMLDFDKLHTFDQINARKSAHNAIARAKGGQA